MHLIDAFMPVIAYVVGFRTAPEEARAGYQKVRGDIGRLLEESASACREEGIPPERYDQGRFAVCAWVDETLLGSGWPDSRLWQHEQLQRVYYNTTEAGVELFERLEALGPEQNDLREVYTLCLSLGFKGRYIGKGDDLLLEQLKSACLKQLMGTPAGLPSVENMELFPGALAASPPAELKATAPFAVTPMTAFFIATPLILFAVLYLIYRYVLGGLVLPIL